jgi:predicted DNA-binding protein (MmcQ/YjbR family)
MKNTHEAEAKLREFGMSFPEATEEFPWGHRALKVKGKTFVFLALEEDVLSLSMKLPASGVAALILPFASPTGYGLGKSGWVTARFAPGEEIPLELLEEWIDESYRAIAPKKLAARIPAG